MSKNEKIALTIGIIALIVMFMPAWVFFYKAWTFALRDAINWKP